MTLIARFALLTTALLSIALTSSGQVFPAPEGEFHTEYDRFKDQTTITLLQVQVAEKQYEYDYQRLYLSTFAVFDRVRPSRKPQSVGILLVSWSLWNNRYLEPASLDAIIDGQRKPYGLMKPISRRVINGKYVASLGGWLTGDDFQHLVAAKKVEMRLGDLEFSLNDHAFKMLRDFANRVQP